MIVFINTLIKNAVVVTVVGAVLGFALAAVPGRIFHQDFFLYRCFPFEKNGAFYEKYFKITRWKDKLPEFSEIVKIGFCKDSLTDLSQNYLDRFLTETMRAEFCHVLLILLSPVYYLFNTPAWGLTMVIATILGNLPFNIH